MSACPETLPECGVFDLIVVGLGPAGIACALQAARDGLRVLAVGDEPAGGLLPAARRIDNLAPFPPAAGRLVAEDLERRLRHGGLPVLPGRVAALNAEAGTGYSCSLADGTRLRARALCLATGTRPAHWDRADGLDPATQHRIHRDARSLPADLAGCRLTLVGGGEAALDTALSARDRGAEVTVLLRGQSLRAHPALTAEALAAGIRLRPGSVVDTVAPVTRGWRLGLTGGVALESDELGACIGRVPRDELLRESGGGCWTPSVVQLQRPGLFLAGDLIRGPDRYTAVALGDGLCAARAALRFLEGS